MLSPTDVLGWEYDWLGVDLDGHVGLFSNAGFGFVPESARSFSFEEMEAAIDALIATPAIAAPRIGFGPPRSPHAPGNWQLAAERGLFVFDFDLKFGRSYSLLYLPSILVTLGQLPEVTQRVAGRVRLAVRFAAVRPVCGALLPFSEADCL